MKFKTLILIFFFALNIFLTPLNVFAADTANEKTGQAETVDVYALFWPIVPGKTIADSLFWVKQIKEGMGEFFSFGNVNKSKYQISLSEKRLVEATKLLEDKDFSNAKKSLELNKSNRNQALSLKKKALEEKQNVLELTTRLVNSLEKQQKALIFLIDKFPDGQKSEIEGLIKDLTLQISEAK